MSSFSTRDLQSFIEKIRSLAVDLTFLYPKDLRCPGWASSDTERIQKKKEWEQKTKNLPLAFGIEWISGGQGGGNCYDDQPIHYPVESSPEPDFTDLDRILEHICPDLGFLTYKRLRSEIVQVGFRNETEYYGNWTRYSQKWVKVEDLHKWLLKEGLLSP